MIANVSDTPLYSSLGELDDKLMELLEKEENLDMRGRIRKQRSKISLSLDHQLDERVNKSNEQYEKAIELLKNAVSEVDKAIKGTKTVEEVIEVVAKVVNFVGRIARSVLQA